MKIFNSSFSFHPFYVYRQYETPYKIKVFYIQRFHPGNFFFLLKVENAKRITAFAFCYICVNARNKRVLRS